MAIGTASGASCYGTQAEAATMLCSSLHGVSAAGAVSCVGVTGASTTGGGVGTIELAVRTLTGSGPITETLAVPLLACETYELDYWQPIIVAWVAAAVAVIAAKMAYTRIFGAPTHA